MRKSVTLIAGVVLAAAVAGCATNRVRPDEFSVSRQRPLVVPPDYALVPPQPGAAVVQQQTVQGQALDAMFGGTAPRSATESATISAAGRSDPSVRSNVADPGTTVVDKGPTTRDIIAAPEGDGQETRATTTPKP